MFLNFQLLTLLPHYELLYIYMHFFDISILYIYDLSVHHDISSTKHSVLLLIAPLPDKKLEPVKSVACSRHKGRHSRKSRCCQVIVRWTGQIKKRRLCEHNLLVTCRCPKCWLKEQFSVCLSFFFSKNFTFLPRREEKKTHQHHQTWLHHVDQHGVRSINFVIFLPA